MSPVTAVETHEPTTEGEDGGGDGLVPSDPDELCNDEGEVVVELTSGWTLREGSDVFVSGDYVRLCRPDGSEEHQWDWAEWHDDPELVMGAIINSAAATALLGRTWGPNG